MNYIPEMCLRSPLFYLDGYKTGHHQQYPKGTTKIVSNFTPRSSRIKGIDRVVFFGLQYYIKEYLENKWAEFFLNDEETVVSNYRDILVGYLGAADAQYHIRKLHQLQYLPITIRALPEGTRVPIGMPMFTIENTHPDFYWLPNFLETQISASVWAACTSATIAREFYQNFLKYAELTGAPKSFIPYQGHDFSMRGMSSIESSWISGMGHLLSFAGTDTIPAILAAKAFYRDAAGASVPATEHSVMCAGGEVNEMETFDRLISEVYPNGIVSIVSDTWDFWGVLTNILPKLKDKILARNGKVVIRPDSGDPVKIICGDPDGKTEMERKGAVQVLSEIFGYTLTPQDYMVLDPHIGLIYGDSINLERQVQILEGLKAKGFASSNVVLGIGSYTYQYQTRDTFGFAMKATYAENSDGKGIEIFKNPKTDDGTKRSAKGLIFVGRLPSGQMYSADQQSKEDFESARNMLQPVYTDGALIQDLSFSNVINNMANS